MRIARPRTEDYIGGMRRRSENVDLEAFEDLFPTVCHFKVIAVDFDHMEVELNEVLAGLGLERHSFARGNRSTGGKYVTYETSIHVESRDQMVEIDGALRAVQGVKMVL